MTISEPSWLTRLRQALIVATKVDGTIQDETFLHCVQAGDLREAIGAAAPGPGSVALVGWGAQPGCLTIDYQTLVRWVHLSPREAQQFAETILKQLHEGPHDVAEARRLSSASQN